MSKKKKSPPDLVDIITAAFEVDSPSLILFEGTGQNIDVAALCEQLDPNCKAKEREFEEAFKKLETLIDGLGLDEAKRKEFQFALRDVSDGNTGETVAFAEALFDGFVHTIARRALPWLFQAKG